MSEGKIVGGGAGTIVGASAAATALVTVAAIGGAAALIKKAYDTIQDEIEKERVAKRLQELELLQQNIADGQKAAEAFINGVEQWELETKCKALETQRKRHMERMKKASLRKFDSVAPPKQGNSEILKKEVERLQREIAQQEDELRQAITKALESHHAAQGVTDSIGNLAELPAPVLETPSSLLSYAEEMDRIQKSRGNASAVAAYGNQVSMLLEKLKDKVIPQPVLNEIAELVAEFNRAKESSQAQELYQRINQKVSDANSIAKKEEPLRRRLAEAQAMAKDLLKAPDDQDIQWIYGDCDKLDEKKITALDNSLKKAKARDEQWIREQQQRLTLEAAMCSLLNLGYKTSANISEAAWWKKGSLFFTRPEWGSHVIRLTYDKATGNIRFYVGSMDDEAVEPPTDAETKKVVGAWCESMLPELLETLKKQNVDLKVTQDIDYQGKAIQKIKANELDKVDKQMAESIRLNARRSRATGAKLGAKEREIS